MKKFFDSGLNLLRKKSLINIFKSCENWAEKIGLLCLYFILPIMGAIFCAKYDTGLDRMFGSAFGVCIGFIIACLLLGYVADKMLEYVRPSIEQAKTNIVNSAFFDIVALLFAIIAILGAIVGFVAIFTEKDKVTSLAVFLLSALPLYFSVMLLSPDKMLNVNVQKSATPAQSLIAITALVIKSFYRLVPLAFGALMIWAVIDGFDLTFISDTVSRYDVNTFVSRLLMISLLPLVGYFVFLTYYFVLDLCMSLFRIADATEKLAETKSQKIK